MAQVDRRHCRGTAFHYAWFHQTVQQLRSLRVNTMLGFLTYTDFFDSTCIFLTLSASPSGLTICERGFRPEQTNLFI